VLTIAVLAGVVSVLIAGGIWLSLGDGATAGRDPVQSVGSLLAAGRGTDPSPKAAAQSVAGMTVVGAASSVGGTSARD
jgi:hypothetical protein